VYTRSAGVWAQQGLKLTGVGEIGPGGFGYSVALSADGDTALMGGPFDSSNVGAAWAFTRSAGAWTQQGPKLTGSGETGQGGFGLSVALSAGGDTALIGGPIDNNVGAAWVFIRSAGSWTQQGPKLTGSGETGQGGFGSLVRLSGDRNTALIGGFNDNSFIGAAWVFASPAISSPPSLDFGSQTTGQLGPVTWLPIVNSGQAPLTFTGPAQITGPDASEFAIPAGDDLCDATTVKPGQMCLIGVQFSVTADGPHIATLSFGANNTYPPMPTVSLSGTGVAADGGPAGPSGSQGTTGTQGTPGADGTPGPQGATGPQGSTGSQGSTGPQGPAGPQGPTGRLVLVAFKARVNAKRVVVSYALTRPANITLSIAAGRRRPITVAHTRGHAGINRLTWNRKLAGKRAAPRAYRLLVTATANNKRAKSTLHIRLR
jgi:hypothetical protein